MMLLRIDSSTRATSVTRRLTAIAAEKWKENYPDGDVMYRDLSVT
jgi:FMN-dependent NADH-azoreductase